MTAGKRRITWCMAAAVGMTALGCAAAGPGGGAPGGGAAAAGKTYTCKDGQFFSLEKIEGTSRLRLTFQDGKYTALAPVEGKQGTYSDGIATLTFEGESVNVVFAGDGAPMRECLQRR